MSPAISIVIPVYNRADLVRAAIGSVLKQTRADFELIVWDDGSTDGTIESARAAANDDPRVRIVSGEHANQVIAANRAAEQARGRYIGFLDSDDGLAPTALAETSAVLDTEPDVGMVYSSYLVMNEEGRVVGPGKRCKIPYSPQRLLIDFMTFHFRLMRRDLYLQLGGQDASLAQAADYDLCLRLSEITRIRHLDRPLYFYRVHRQTISHRRRLEQIMSSREAIARALKRRGMDEKFQIDVELVGRFRLVPRRENDHPAAEATSGAG